MSGTADLAGVTLGLARDDEFAARSLLAIDGVADAILDVVVVAEDLAGRHAVVRGTVVERAFREGRVLSAP
jgi:hypothetical protein